MKKIISDYAAQFDLDTLDDIQTAIKDEVSRTAQGNGSFNYSRTTRMFKEEFKHLINGRYIAFGHAVACSSGTMALATIYKHIFRSTSKRVVIVPEITYHASVTAIEAAGGTPFAVDVDKDTWTICHKSVDRAIKHVGEDLAAITSVNLFGVEPDVSYCDGGEYLPHVYDASHGSPDRRFNMYGNMQTRPDYVAVSLNRKKLMPALASAGIILCGSFKEENGIDDFIFQGRSKDSDDIDITGTNGMVSSIEMAVLMARMKYLPAIVDCRERIGEIYDASLARFPETIRLQNSEHGSSRYRYVISIQNSDRFIMYLQSRDIPASRVYPRLMSDIEGVAAFDNPVAEKLRGTLVELPCNQYITDDQVEYILEAIHDYINDIRS